MSILKWLGKKEALGGGGGGGGLCIYSDRSMSLYESIIRHSPEFAFKEMVISICTL